MVLEPISHDFELRCRPERAFTAYDGSAGPWWHPEYTPVPGSFEKLTIGPGVDGPVVLSHRGLGDFVIGQVTVWDPPGRLAYTSTLAQAPDHPSEISVSFTLPLTAATSTSNTAAGPRATQQTARSSAIGP